MVQSVKCCHASMRTRAQIPNRHVKAWHSQSHMPVVPALGRQRRRDSWGLLASQASWIEDLQVWWEGGPYVKKKGGEGLRKTPEVLLYTCAHGCVHVCTSITRGGREGKLANLECKGGNESTLEWNKTMALFYRCPGSLTTRWTFFCMSEFGHKDYYISPLHPKFLLVPTTQNVDYKTYFGRIWSLSPVQK